MHLKRMIAAMGVLVLASSVVACSSSDNAGEGSSSDNAGEGGSFEILTGFTAGNEAKGLAVLLDALEAKDTGVEIVNGAVGGVNSTGVQQELQSRMAAGTAPSSWVSFSGEMLRQYVSSDLAADLTSIYEDLDLASHLAPSTIEQLTVDGQIVAATMEAHQTNMIFYNNALLNAQGLKLSAESSIDELLAGLEKLTATSEYPLCFGNAGGFGAQVLFESTLMGSITADEWNALFSEELTWDSEQVTKGVENFVALLAYASPSSTSTDWTDAIDSLTEGDCAVDVMGQWSYGEIIDNGKTLGDGEDEIGFGSFPGSANTFGFASDVFLISRDAVDSPAARAWVEVLNDPEVQVEFALTRGMIPTRTDADLDSLPSFLQDVAAVFGDTEVKQVGSLFNAQVVSTGYFQAWADALVSLTATGDSDAFIATMVSVAEKEM